MTGGKILYLEKIGDCVKTERTNRKMSQIKFYKYLYPDSNLTNESIKSYMNDIEKAKRKTIDPDFLLALHEKCNLGMDYVFGYETEFPNHENENASNYTGLSVQTIELLHELAKSVTAEIPALEECEGKEDWERRCKLISDKQGAEWILRIIEVLLTEDVETSEGSYPNYSILFDLYMMAIMKPERINGVVVESDRKMGDLMSNPNKSKEIDMNSLFMKDSFGFLHTIQIDEVHQQIWKDKLKADIERFIPVARKYFSEKIISNEIT